MSLTPQRRSRSVLVFGQFGGAACQESLGDRESCTTSETCVQPPPPECLETDFQCESGTSATRHVHLGPRGVGGSLPSVT